MRTMVVMHGDLDDPAAPVLKLFHHLDANHAAIAGKPDLLEETPPEEAEIAVDIPDPQPEEKAHNALIEKTAGSVV